MEVFEDGELEEKFRSGGGTGDITPWALFQRGYERLVNFITQPDRKIYTVDQLGSVEYESDGLSISRIDFEVETATIGTRTLVGSFWRVQDQTPQRPCILYLHCNTGCRLDALSIRDKALSNGFNVAAFDFAGCGHSADDHVTGGLNESRDIGRIISHLRVSESSIGDVYLWSHSMGAAAALMYSAESDVVSGLVLDSTYLSLTQLAEDMALTVKNDGFTAPSWILRRASKLICSSVEAKAGFQVEKVRPIDCATRCTMPAMILTATRDKYVPTHHADTIVHEYGGRASQIRFEGDHYGPRPSDIIDFGIEFLKSIALRQCARK